MDQRHKQKDGAGSKGGIWDYIDLSKLGAVMPIIVTVVYFAVSFATGWWAYTWILFVCIPFLGALMSVVRDYQAHEKANGTVDMTGGGNGQPQGADAPSHGCRVKPGELKKLITTAIVPLYFIVSFAIPGIWSVSWLMFLLIPIAHGVIRD